MSKGLQMCLNEHLNSRLLDILENVIALVIGFDTRQGL